MERYILIGVITKIEQRQNNNGDGSYAIITVQHKNVWTDKNGAKQSQMITKNILTSNSKILNEINNNELVINDMVQITGIVKASTYTNNNGEVKSTLNITPLTIDNLSNVYK